MPYLGKLGHPCPVCGAGLIRSQFSRTCSVACGVKLKKQEAATAPQAAPPSKEEFRSDESRATLTRTTSKRVKSLPDLIESCDIDTSQWDVERWICEKYDTVSVPRATGNDKDGWKRDDARPQVTEMFLIKAWLVRKHAVIAAREEIRAMLADAKAHAPKYPVIRRPQATSGNMLELNITDHHFAKLAWGTETGYEDYDVRRAEELYDAAGDALIQRSSSLKYDQVVIVIGNDLFHSDNNKGTTTRGTQLSVDSRYKKTYPLVRRAAVRLIDKARAVAPVQVKIVPGNHDELTAFCLGDSLECWYHKCPDVEIDNSAPKRKYLQWGQVMLMWTHGDTGKLDDYPLLMASEKPQMWGATKWHEAHTGDKHQRKLIELKGVAVRILPTLCAPDDWHSDNHYVGNQRCSEAYMWNNEEGLVGTAVYSAPPRKAGQ